LIAARLTLLSMMVAMQCEVFVKAMCPGERMVVMMHHGAWNCCINHQTVEFSGFLWQFLQQLEYHAEKPLELDEKCKAKSIYFAPW